MTHSLHEKYRLMIFPVYHNINSASCLKHIPDFQIIIVIPGIWSGSHLENKHLVRWSSRPAVQAGARSSE